MQRLKEYINNVNQNLFTAFYKQGYKNTQESETNNDLKWVILGSKKKMLFTAGNVKANVEE